MLINLSPKPKSFFTMVTIFTMKNLLVFFTFNSNFYYYFILIGLTVYDCFDLYCCYLNEDFLIKN